jgi:alpha-N-arabinofuranosidase
MEPVLAVWGGMYLGGNDVLTLTELEPWVNDTMNELEFILGPATSHFGALRASLGYPKPWSVKYVEIGNEDDLQGGAASYAAYRFKMFYDAITAKYPSITVISSTGDLTAVGPGSATDFHIYTRPDDFVSRFGFFDHSNRSHPILIGEYAMVQNNEAGQIGTDWSAPRVPHTTWVGAVSEAVWSIGAERNSDVVFGMSYAPGFQNLNSYEWSVCFPLPCSPFLLYTS